MKIGIVGGGVFGLSAAWELAKNGHQVDLFERDLIPAPRAAGTDISKAIRLEYGDRCRQYSNLVGRAFDAWRKVEQSSGRRFFQQTGVLALATRFTPGEFEHDSYTTLSEMGFTLEIVAPKEGRKRWPMFAWDLLECAVANPLGGWLASSLAVEALADCARHQGAEILEECPVSKVGSGWLEAGERRFYDVVIVSAGAWIGRLLPELAGQVRVTRQRITFYRPNSKSFACPVWIHDPARSGWYGFPMNSEGIVKVALHTRSEEVDPDESREIDQAFLEESRNFVQRWLPGLDPATPVTGRCCFYTNSESGDFVIDRLDDQLWVAGCGSGHAFKFGPVLGELLVEALESGTTVFPFGAQSKGQTW